MKERRRRLDRTVPADTGSLAEDGHQVRALVHELQVHSEEITVQNEQLLKAQTELEQARDRYADLFDFSPVGYLTLDKGSVIREINLAATAMFGRQRSFLVGLPLINLVAVSSRRAFRRFTAEAADPKVVSTTVEVELRPPSDRVVSVIARHVRARTGGHELFTVLVDVTAQRRLEKAHQAALASERHRSAELRHEIEVRIAAEERIKSLLERLVSVQEQERRRLALNLHDHLGQQITALRLAISTLRETVDATENSSRLDRIDQLVTQLDRDIDFFAWELRPAALDDVGLEPAIRAFVGQWSTTSKVVAEFHANAVAADRLPTDIESNLYRIVQEALNNVAKHAKAQHVSVLLERKNEEISLIVEDDGCGFEMAAVLSNFNKGMGLAGIRERTALIGGEVEIESSPGNGTTLFVRIPLAARIQQGTP